MAAISTDKVIHLLEMLRETKIDDFHMEMPCFHLRVRKKARTEAFPNPGPAGEVTNHGETSFRVKAPALGVFHLAPRPGGSLLTARNRLVSQGELMGLIEVLGEFHEVRSGLSGRVKEICAVEGGMVEYDQTLFLLEESSRG